MFDMNRRELFQKVSQVAAGACVPIDNPQIIESDPRPLAIVVKFRRFTTPEERKQMRKDWSEVCPKLPQLILIGPEMDISIVPSGLKEQTDV